MSEPSQVTSLTGRLLVATPALDDPNFSRSVVLLVDHDEEGALGVVLNRPSATEVGEILPAWQDHVAVPAVVFGGGPVGRSSALAIAALTPGEGDDEPLGYRHVHGRLGLVDLDAPPEILMAHLSGVRVFNGYAGWGPGQLEDELADDAWFVVPSLTADVFTDRPEQLWPHVLRRQGGELALVSTYPEDPSLN